MSLSSILGSQREDVQNDFPSRSNKLSLLITQSWNTHDYIFFDLFLSIVQVGKHDSFKWLQEHFLIAKVLPLFFLEELIS
jgi:hypothetical protein